MNIHDLFEQHYADHNDTTAQNVRSCRLSNGSYNNLPIARAFRMFKAGFEANSGDSMRLLGYLSKKGAQSASQGRAAFFYTGRSRNATEAVFVRESEGRNGGVACLKPSAGEPPKFCDCNQGRLPCTCK